MYQAGKRIVSHQKRHIMLACIVVPVLAVLAGGSYAAAKHFLKPDTNISKAPPPVVNTVIAKNSATKKFSEGDFAISLPTDWIYTGRANDIYHAYTFENTAGNKGTRVLAVYVDNIPTALGVNRVLPVEASGDRVIPNTVSDNCANFTGNKVPGSASTPAKWAGIDFLCDLANYARNVSGTSSPGAINSVTLTGPKIGQRKIFFTYTDDSAEPNYQIFYDALQSFRLN